VLAEVDFVGSIAAVIDSSPPQSKAANGHDHRMPDVGQRCG
jgi:hypothetical protein